MKRLKIHFSNLTFNFMNQYKEQGGNDMQKKLHILDYLVDSGEAETQIMDFFKLIKVDINVIELRKILNEMLDDKLIVVSYKWVNEFGERPYSLTEKGRSLWRESTDGFCSCSYYEI